MKIIYLTLHLNIVDEPITIFQSRLALAVILNPIWWQPVVFQSLVISPSHKDSVLSSPPYVNSHLSHYSDVIMSAMASLITGVSIVNSTVCSDADQRKHQSSASLAFVRGIHRWPVNSPHKGQVTRKMFPFDDVIMRSFYFWSLLKRCIDPDYILHSSVKKHIWTTWPTTETVIGYLSEYMCSVSKVVLNNRSKLHKN